VVAGVLEAVSSAAIFRVELITQETTRSIFSVTTTLSLIRIWFVRMCILAYMEMVTAEIGRFARKHEGRLLRHDAEAIQLLDNSELLRRLKRTNPFKLVQ
jgi:hypothetical protein